MAEDTAAAKPGSIFSADNIKEEGKDAISSVPDAILKDLDAIFVLGGGVPASFNDPPEYVKERCDVAARLFFRQAEMTGASGNVSILTLSAGTAHMPQLLSSDGLPVWESTASAAYLMENHNIPSKHLFVETTSYDTISNAYFSRTSFTDVLQWRKILIITTEFHMGRSKAIFDWIFGAKRSKFDDDDSNKSTGKYELYYLSTANIGLTEEALKVRREHEARGEKNVQSKLSKRYSTLADVMGFLTTNHDFYSASKLVERAATEAIVFDPRSMALKLSYGAKSDENSSSALFLVAIIFAAFAVAIFVLKSVSRAQKNARIAINPFRTNPIHKSKS